MYVAAAASSRSASGSIVSHSRESTSQSSTLRKASPAASVSLLAVVAARHACGGGARTPPPRLMLVAATSNVQPSVRRRVACHLAQRTDVRLPGAPRRHRGRDLSSKMPCRSSSGCSRTTRRQVLPREVHVQAGKTRDSDLSSAARTRYGTLRGPLRAARELDRANPAGTNSIDETRPGVKSDGHTSFGTLDAG